MLKPTLIFGDELTVALLVIIIIAVLIYNFKRWPLYQQAAQFPGPVAYPIIGNALQFTGSTNQLLNRLVTIVDNYPSPCRVWFGPQLCVIVYSPEDLEVVLTCQKNTYKDYTYQFMEPFVGQGLISGSGPIWKLHRKLILPTFNSKTMQSYIETFNHHSNVLIEKLNQVANTEIDIIEYLNLCTVDIILSTVMGIEAGAQNNELETFVSCVEIGYRTVHERMMKVWLHPDCIFRVTSTYRESKYAQKVIQDFAEKHLRNKKMEFEEKRKNGTLDETKLSTLESLLLVSGSEFSDIELRDEIYTIFTAGQDTTATITSFVLLMLGLHPDIQNKLYEEVSVKCNYPKENFCLEWKEYGEYTYLDMVVKETLRLFPIGPMIIRKTTHDLQLKTHLVPKGTSLMITMFKTHRLPEIWPNPEMFIPERFTPELNSKRHPFAYVPFSAGPRSCIGSKYAMLVIKTIVLHVMKNFRISCDQKYEDLRIKADISVRSLDGYKMKLTPRL